MNRPSVTVRAASSDLEKDQTTTSLNQPFGPRVRTYRKRQIEMGINLHFGGCSRPMRTHWKDLEVYF